jgi:hypothetical protein
MALGWPVLACAMMAAAARPQAGAAETLDNEAVVGMVASGMAEIAIVRAIQDAPRVSFDLDPEVVRELAAAGVTPKIIQAMRDRQGPAPVLEKPVPPPAPQGKLLVRLRSDGGKKGEPVVYEVIRKIPKWAANEMGMLQRPEVEELAFFLLCTRPDHVPDHWQDRSELKGFTRHEKLLFRTGSRPGKSRGFEVLALDLPESLDLSTDAGNHRLVAGVAAKAGPDWHVVGSAELKSVEVLAGETTTLEVTLGGKVTGSRMSAFKEQQSVSMVEIPRGSATP